MQEGSVHIDGDNLNASAKLSMSYTDLHIDPLKDADENGKLKKKHASSLIANVLIKNSNPAKAGALRQPEYTISRAHSANFFSMLWKATETGILKTIGVPVKLVIH